MIEPVSSTSNFLKKLRTILPPAVLIVTNIFLFGPLTIYSGNIGEFQLAFMVISGYLILPALILVLTLSLLGAILPPHLHKMYAVAIFILGILIWMEGNILVWKYGLFDGQGINWSKDQWRGWVDGAVWLTFVSIGVLAYRNIFRVVASGSVGMITLQLILSIYIALTQPDIWKSDYPKPSVAPAWASEFSSDRNVIHIILDGIQSDILEEIIREDSTLYSKTFEGFTFFKDATGHFPTTYPSVPAIVSGTIYKNDIPIHDYIKKTLSGQTTLNVLHQNGFEVDLIPASPTYIQGHYTHAYMIPAPYTGTITDYEWSKAALMIDLVLFRHTPHLVKRLIYNDQKWFMQRLTAKDESLQFQRFSDERFLQDVTKAIKVNREKPVYKFYHLALTHVPMITNLDCEYAGAMLPDTRENVVNQTRCSLSSFVSFLESLKSANIYDNALIIVHGDHGSVAPVYLDEGDGLSIGYNISPWVVSSARPALLIKPPHRKGPLNISPTQVMLLDIPSTISGLLNLDARFPGMSVFAGQSTDFRERKYYVYEWRHANWQAEYLPPLDEYSIKGGVIEKRSWTVEPHLPQSGSYTTNEIKLGTKDAAPFIGYGWSYREIDPTRKSMGVTWAIGDSASIIISLPKEQVKMIANVKSIFYGIPQNVAVKVDEKLAGSWNMTNPPQWEQHSVLIPADRLRPKLSTIKFIFSQHRTPTKLGERRLALLFESLSFEPLAP